MGQIHIVFELLFGRRHLLISLGVDLNKKKKKILGFALMLLTVFLAPNLEMFSLYSIS